MIKRNSFATSHIFILLAFKYYHTRQYDDVKECFNQIGKWI